MKLNDREHPLEIYGPRGTASMVGTLMKVGYFRPNFEVVASDLEPGAVLRFDGYTMESIEVEHNAPTIGYRFQEDQRTGRFDKPKALELGIPEGRLFGKLQRGHEVEVEGRVIKPEDVLGPPRKGRVIVYSGDTAPCLSIIQASEGADVLIHEGTFDPSMSDKAVEHDHSSVDMAADVARRAEVKRLYIIHISPRYEDVSPLLKAAREIFSESFIPRDLDEYELS